MKIFNKYVHATGLYVHIKHYIAILYHNCNIYPHLQLYIARADSITRNFSCTDVNNNLQLKTAELLELS